MLGQTLIFFDISESISVIFTEYWSFVFWSGSKRAKLKVWVLYWTLKNYVNLAIFPLHSPYADSVQLSLSVVSDSLRPHEPQHTRPPRPSPTLWVYSNSCPSSWWYHPIISSSVIPFSHLRSFPASGSFPMSQFFASGGQRIEVSASASFLPMNTQYWSPLGQTGWISLQFKGLPRVFSNTTVQKHQFFGAQLSLWSNSHIHTWPPEKP